MPVSPTSLSSERKRYKDWQVLQRKKKVEDHGSRLFGSGDPGLGQPPRTARLDSSLEFAEVHVSPALPDESVPQAPGASRRGDLPRRGPSQGAHLQNPSYRRKAIPRCRNADTRSSSPNRKPLASTLSDAGIPQTPELVCKKPNQRSPRATRGSSSQDGQFPRCGGAVHPLGSILWSKHTHSEKNRNSKDAALQVR